MRKSCPTCSRTRPPGQSHCDECLAAGKGPQRGRNGSWSQNRDMREHRAMKLRVGDAAGWRCQYVVRPELEDEDQFVPYRCLEDRPSKLDLHHLPDGSGVLLCDDHHYAVDPHARVRRAGR